MLCRTREKINRPQTRRRRDNSEELLDKMRLLKDNLAAARSIMDEVVRRERRKRDLAVRDEAGTPLPPCPPSLPLSPPSPSLNHHYVGSMRLKLVGGRGIRWAAVWYGLLTCDRTMAPGMKTVIAYSCGESE